MRLIMMILCGLLCSCGPGFNVHLPAADKPFLVPPTKAFSIEVSPNSSVVQSVSCFVKRNSNGPEFEAATRQSGGNVRETDIPDALAVQEGDRVQARWVVRYLIGGSAGSISTTEYTQKFWYVDPVPKVYTPVEGTENVPWVHDSNGDWIAVCWDRVPGAGGYLVELGRGIPVTQDNGFEEGEEARPWESRHCDWFPVERNHWFVWRVRASFEGVQHTDPSPWHHFRVAP